MKWACWKPPKVQFLAIWSLSYSLMNSFPVEILGLNLPPVWSDWKSTPDNGCLVEGVTWVNALSWISTGYWTCSHTRNALNSRISIKLTCMLTILPKKSRRGWTLVMNCTFTFRVKSLARWTLPYGLWSSSSPTLHLTPAWDVRLQGRLFSLFPQDTRKPVIKEKLHYRKFVF